MIARAYEYAQGAGATPPELRLARYVDRFGAQAIFGRVLSASEANRIMTAEAVMAAYRSRAKSGNWAAWVNEHPEEARLLGLAAELTDGEQS